MIGKLQYISQQAEDGSHLPAIQSALDAGCTWVQLRIKYQPDEVVLETALAAKELCKQYNATLILNDYPAIALQAETDGVHLGLSDMSVPGARTLLGAEYIIGGTANTFENIRQRVSEGADYIGLGPFRFTSTKKILSPILGLEGYAAIMEQVRAAGITIPIVAVGGILAADVPALLDLGFYGIAISGAITYAQDPSATVKELYGHLNTHKLVAHV